MIKKESKNQCDLVDEREDLCEEVRRQHVVHDLDELLDAVRTWRHNRRPALLYMERLY